MRSPFFMAGRRGAGMRISGRVRVDRKTKELAKRLRPGEIAVIDHPDLDEVAARSLLEAGARAVINARSSITGRYPNLGPQILLDAGVPILDAAGPGVLQRLREGDLVHIEGPHIFSEDGRPLGSGMILTPRMAKARLARARAQLGPALEAFIDNTLEYAKREKSLVSGRLPVPPLKTRIKNRHAVVVVRGSHYKDDLRAIASFIEETHPVLIGVDGGADALLEHGLRPDIITGDMDSVSDAALRSGAELVVHAYPDGRAPGWERVQALGLSAHQIAAPGTSEDIALLLAYELGADLIVAVGTHSNLIDFLEKGRPGMASTFLVRMKVGSILVDARGVSKLYRGKPKGRYPLQVAVAAMIPVLLASLLAEPVRQTFRLLLLQVRLWLLG